MFRRADVWFGSGGDRCAAWLYRPTAATGVIPCVVMAHGTTGTRDLGLAAYAERFAVAGFADRRVRLPTDFGASDGTPRQLVSIRHQLDDWRAAIRSPGRFRMSTPTASPSGGRRWAAAMS